MCFFEGIFTGVNANVAQILGSLLGSLVTKQIENRRNWFIVSAAEWRAMHNIVTGTREEKKREALEIVQKYYNTDSEDLAEAVLFGIGMIKKYSLI